MTWAICIVYRAFFILSGFFLQPLAIWLGKEDKSTTTPFSSFPEHGDWVRKTAPQYLYPWGNARDGFYGDKRGWWSNERKGNHKSFWSQYLWSAIRNPCNNLRFMPLSSVNVRDAKSVELLAGQEYVRDRVGDEGWQFVRVVDKNSIPYYGLYFVKVKKNGKGVVIRLGFKIEPKHAYEYAGTEDEDNASYNKGMTFKISFNKTL